MSAPSESAAADAEGPAFALPMLKAARPKTLVAAVVPVWLGFAIARADGAGFDRVLFAFTLLATLCIQVATNYFNDAIDHRKGADTGARLGPARMAGSGALRPESLMIAGVTLLLMAAAFATPLIAARGWPIVAIGIPSLYLTYGYTGGPVPLAYRGLGELFVVLFFGVVAVAGSAFVASGVWSAGALLLGVQAGLLATVLIAVNNARDIDEDRASGKRTLAARFGLGFARAEVWVCCVAPYLLGLVWLVPFGEPLRALLPMIGLGFSLLVAFGVLASKPGVIFNRYLALAALALLNFAGLMTAALFLA